MIKVAVWGAGMMGQGLLRYILERPKDVELVGVIDRHPEKHGMTLGGLLGEVEHDMRITADIDSVLALDPEQVASTPSRAAFAEALVRRSAEQDLFEALCDAVAAARVDDFVEQVLAGAVEDLDGHQVVLRTVDQGVWPQGQVVAGTEPAAVAEEEVLGGAADVRPVHQRPARDVLPPVRRATAA